MTDLFLRRGLKYGETAESIFPAKSFYDYRYSGENETSAGKYTMRGKNKLNFQNYNTRQVGNRQRGNRNTNTLCCMLCFGKLSNHFKC